MTLKISGLDGYYTVKAIEYCYLVSCRVADQIPGSSRACSKFCRYLCRKCTPGPLSKVFGTSRASILKKHLLDVHGILADIHYRCGHTHEGLYRLIPPENFVKGGSLKMYPDAILWRWAEAFEENREPRVVRTPLAVHKVGTKVVDPQGDHSRARNLLGRDCQQSEEKSTLGQVDWNEELWLSLISIVEKLEDEKIFRKWNRVPTLVPPRLVRKFSKAALGQRLLSKRFQGLAWELKCDLKPQRYTKGVTEEVIKRMQGYCKNRKIGPKNVQDNSTHPEKRVYFKKVPSIKASLNMELNKQLNSLVGMLDEQLLPTTVKHAFDTCLDISKHVLSENRTTRKVLKLAIKVAYHRQRGVIVAMMKQHAHSLRQVVNMWKVAN